MQNEKTQASPLGGAMLNLYPDSLGANLSEAAAFLSNDAVRGAFSALYVLPSLFHTDLDRGFSVIDYGIEETLATQADLDAIRASGVSLKLDFVLNHASVQSPQFQDMIARGDDSPYRDFFIDWNAFWQDHGEMTQEGYIQPDAQLIADMFFRKPGLPILMVRFPDKTERPYVGIKVITHGDKTGTEQGKYLFDEIAGFNAVPSKPGKVLDDDAVNFALPHKL